MLRDNIKRVADIKRQLLVLRRMVDLILPDELFLGRIPLQRPADPPGDVQRAGGVGDHAVTAPQRFLEFNLDHYLFILVAAPRVPVVAPLININLLRLNALGRVDKLNLLDLVIIYRALSAKRVHMIFHKRLFLETRRSRFRHFPNCAKS